MLVTESRPRTLRWTYAGPMLYGDWGTSRLYVLGLAFLYTAHASVTYLAAISLLLLAVGWAYTVVCRCFPGGGGVYSAARQLSPTASVVGATLLFSGYIMTASISVIEAFHYFGASSSLVLPLGILSILLIGGINWFGAQSAGRFALVVAMLALGVSAVITVLCIPFFLIGITTINFDYFTTHATPVDAWVSFTKICLALAGVEAVANMTGLMKEPVAKQAKRTIWPVTIEVVALNMLFGIALTGLAYTVDGVPLADQHRPHYQMLQSGELSEQGVRETENYTNAAMKVIAAESGAHHFGQTGRSVLSSASGIVFGLLLLSATNTALMAMVSVLFALAQDRELPKRLTRLNYSGVPVIPLVIAIVVPIGVIAVEQDVTVLAKLYVLGVCGAVTVTLISTGVNKNLEIGPKSRSGILALGIFLACVSVTIAATQLVATAFSGGLIGIVLGLRAFLNHRRRRTGEALEAPETGWLAELMAPTATLDPARPRIMLASRGRYQSEFAVDLAKRRKAALFAVFVRTLRVMDVSPSRMPRIEDDEVALEALGTTALLARKAGVPFFPIYVVSDDIVGEILDYTVTYNCDTLIMGKTQRSLVARRLEGDVVTRVADGLPDEVALITRSAQTPHVSRSAPTTPRR